MTDQIKSILDDLKYRLGPAFPISQFDREPALPAAKTIRNLRSARCLPENMFIRDGRRVLVITEVFIPWYGKRLSPENFLMCK